MSYCTPSANWKTQHKYTVEITKRELLQLCKKKKRKNGEGVLCQGNKCGIYEQPSTFRHLINDRLNSVNQPWEILVCSFAFSPKERISEAINVISHMEKNDTKKHPQKARVCTFQIYKTEITIFPQAPPQGWVRDWRPRAALRKLK